MYFLKDLINAAPFSQTTFYRRWNEFNENKTIKKFKLQGNYLTEAEAKTIAKELGFEKQFDEFLKTKQK
jgi:hypothetical protein